MKFARHIESGVPCAIKVVKKTYLQAKDKDGLYEKLMRCELEILKRTDHANITKIIELLQSKDEYYIVMEYVSGGDLFKLMTQSGGFTERQVIYIIK